MPSQWRFEQDDQARWQWQLLDTEGESAKSPDSFPDHTACVLSAVRFVVQRRRSQSDAFEDDFAARITN